MDLKYNFFEESIDKKNSLSTQNYHFFNRMIVFIIQTILKEIEKIIGVNLYFSTKNDSFSKISFRTQKIAEAFLKQNIIKKIIKEQRIYYDEPYLFSYTTEVFCENKGVDRSMIICGGADLNEDIAAMKSLGEAAERFCLHNHRGKSILSSYKKLFRKAIDPLSFVGISADQRDGNPMLMINEKSIFEWIPAISLNNSRKVFVPAQLVYVGYKYNPKEPIIRQQISTGAAAASSWTEAVYRGICEVVERDAFMITYLNKLSPPIIDIETIRDKNIQKLLEMLKRYNLIIYVMDITTDIQIPSVMAVAIDKSGVGPAIHVATKTGFNWNENIYGVLCDVIRGRIGFRAISSPVNISEETINSFRKDFSQIRTFIDRSQFWAFPEMINEIEFLFSGKKKKSIPEQNSFNDNENKLKFAVSALKNANIDIYAIDITTSQIKKDGLFIVKTISPQLQPLYLNERMRHVSGDRIFGVPVKLGYRSKPLLKNELNQLPHPFL